VAVTMDVAPSQYETNEAVLRRQACVFCEAPTTATSHVCPCCSTSFCIDCAKERLSQDPRCPTCKTEASEKAALEYLKYVETWGNLARAASGVLGVFSGGAFMAGSKSEPASVSRALSRKEDSSAATPAVVATYVPERPRSLDDDDEPRELYVPREDSPQLKALIKKKLCQQAQQTMLHSCFICRRETSSWDVCCPSCGVSVCIPCAGERVQSDTRCPNCKLADFTTVQSVELMRNAMQVRDTANQLWSGLWGAGKDLFTTSNGGSKSGAADQSATTTTTFPHSATSTLPYSGGSTGTPPRSHSRDGGVETGSGGGISSPSRLQRFMGPVIDSGHSRVQKVWVDEDISTLRL